MTGANGHITPEQDIARKALANGFDPNAPADHRCSTCGAPVNCEFKTIAEARARAKADLLSATWAERKLLNLPMGPPKKLKDYTTEDLRKLVEQFGNINRARKHLGVGFQTLQRRLQEPRVEPLPPGVTLTRREK